MPTRFVRRHSAALVLALAALIARPAVSPAQGAGGTLREITVHGTALEGNLLGIPADRAVSVYLPPSYGQGAQRYPVVYLLHGIFDSNETWTKSWGPPNAPDPGYATVAELMDAGIAAGRLAEMIVVMPDAEKTCHYTDGPVKGGWATFVARDLVGAIDAQFRTVASASGRGLAGHSMGGHGAIKVAMRFPGTFSAVYALNPSMLGWGGDVGPENPALRAAARLDRPDSVDPNDFYLRAIIGIGQCFAPEPSAPLRMRSPVTSGGGWSTDGNDVRAQWTAQMPLYMAPRHADALRSLRGLRFDSAFEDEFTHIPPTARALSHTLDSLGVPHTFEMYNGDHRNRLWGAEGRLYTELLPFFSRLLGSTPGGATPEPRGSAVAAPAATVTGPPATAPSASSASNARAQTALWDAARRGDIRAAERALAGGADVTALDTLTDEGGRSGRRALNFAALHNRPEMIRWLVSKGARLDEPNRTGFTPLHHAAESGAVPAAQALLALGADPNVRLPSGSTPLAVARQRGHAAMVRLLEPVTRR